MLFEMEHLPFKSKAHKFITYVINIIYIAVCILLLIIIPP